MVGGDAEMVIKTDVQRPRRKLGGEVRLPFGGFVGFAVSQVPFADGGGGIAVLFQHGGHGQPGGFDVQRGKGAQHSALLGRTPAVAAGHHRIPCGRADGGGGIRIGKTAAFFGQAVEVRRLDELTVGSVATHAAVAIVIREDDDDVGPVRRKSGGGQAGEAEEGGQEFHGGHGNAVPAVSSGKIFVRRRGRRPGGDRGEKMKNIPIWGFLDARRLFSKVYDGDGNPHGFPIVPQESPWGGERVLGGWA